MCGLNQTLFPEEVNAQRGEAFPKKTRRTIASRSIAWEIACLNFTSLNQCNLAGSTTGFCVFGLIRSLRLNQRISLIRLGPKLTAFIFPLFSSSDRECKSSTLTGLNRSRSEDTRLNSSHTVIS